MDQAFLLPGDGSAGGRGLRLRVSAVVVGLALMFATLIVVQHKAEAAPNPVVATATLASAGAANAQINISQFVCSILLTVRNAFSASPFFSFVVAALNPILVAFGCAPSGTP